MEPIIEENLDTVVDLNQIGNLGASSEPSTVEASNARNSVDFPPAASEIPPSEVLETFTSQVKALPNSHLEFYISNC